MAEQSGKGIALVILGIVAIIAIVGLVLLFTGYKGAAGKFAVPASKEYGGSIKGVMDPYGRAFAGRASEIYPAGTQTEQSAAWYGRGGTGPNAQAFGETNYGDIGRQSVHASNRLLTQSGNYVDHVINGENYLCYLDTEWYGNRATLSGLQECQAAEGRFDTTRDIRVMCISEQDRANIVTAGYGDIGQSVSATLSTTLPAKAFGKHCAILRDANYWV